MQARTFLGLLAAVTMGCGAAQHVAAPPAKPANPAAVKAAVAKFTADRYAAVERGDFPAWATGIDEGGWFGPASTESYTGADYKKHTEEAVGKLLAAGVKIQLTSAGPVIGVAEGGRSAWVTDGITMKVSGVPDAADIRTTAVLAEVDGKWQVVASHWSVGVPNEVAMQMAAANGWPALADIADAAGKGAEPLVPLVDGLLADPAKFAEIIAEGDDVVFLGTAPEEKFSSAAAFRSAFVNQIKTYHVAFARHGAARAGLTPDGKLGWVAANVDLSVEVEGKKVSEPYRALLVFQNQAGTWRLVQGHFSNGIPR